MLWPTGGGIESDQKESDASGGEVYPGGVKMKERLERWAKRIRLRLWPVKNEKGEKEHGAGVGVKFKF